MAKCETCNKNIVAKCAYKRRYCDNKCRKVAERGNKFYAIDVTPIEAEKRRDLLKRARKGQKRAMKTLRRDSSITGLLVKGEFVRL